MILEAWQMDLMRIGGSNSPQPFTRIYEFIKNNQKMTSIDFKSTLDSITDSLDLQGVNYGILILTSGFVVFTEVELNLDKVIFKLATGVNFEGQMSNVDSMLKQVNNHLGRDKTE